MSKHVVRSVLGALLLASASVAFPKGKKVEFAPLMSLALPPKTATEVEMFITNKPDRPYDELGLLSRMSWNPKQNPLEIYTLFREKAAAVGADAIIILDPRSGTTGNWVTKTTYGYTEFRAVAVAYRK
jgi:hypothetical protein